MYMHYTVFPLSINLAARIFARAAPLECPVIQYVIFSFTTSRYLSQYNSTKIFNTFFRDIKILYDKTGIPIGGISHVKITAPISLPFPFCSIEQQVPTTVFFVDAMISNITIAMADPSFRKYYHLYTHPHLFHSNDNLLQVYSQLHFQNHDISLHILYSGYVRICSSFLQHFIINKRRLIINEYSPKPRETEQEFFAVNILDWKKFLKSMVYSAWLTG